MLGALGAVFMYLGTTPDGHALISKWAEDRISENNVSASAIVEQSAQKTTTAVIAALGNKTCGPLKDNACFIGGQDSSNGTASYYIYIDLDKNEATIDSSARSQTDADNWIEKDAHVVMSLLDGEVPGVSADTSAQELLPLLTDPNTHLFQSVQAGDGEIYQQQVWSVADSVEARFEAGKMVLTDRTHTYTIRQPGFLVAADKLAVLTDQAVEAIG